MRQLIASLSLLLLGAQSNPALPLPDASGLWEQMLMAKGGRERLHDIRIVAISMRKRGDEYDIVIQPPSDVWWWTKGPGVFLSYLRVWNGAKGLYWSGRVDVPAGAPGAVIPDRRDQLNAWAWDYRQHIDRDLAVFFLETALVQPKPLAVRRASKTTVYLDVSLPRFQDAFYTVDLRTARITAVNMTPVSPTPTPGFQGASYEDRYEFQGNRTVDGVQMPTRVRWGSTWRDVTFHINPNVDPKMFETQPLGVKTGDDWRKWLRP